MSIITDKLEKRFGKIPEQFTDLTETEILSKNGMKLTRLCYRQTAVYYCTDINFLADTDYIEIMYDRNIIGYLPIEEVKS